MDDDDECGGNEADEAALVDEDRRLDEELRRSMLPLVDLCGAHPSARSPSPENKNRALPQQAPDATPMLVDSTCHFLKIEPRAMDVQPPQGQLDAAVPQRVEKVEKRGAKRSQDAAIVIESDSDGGNDIKPKKDAPKAASPSAAGGAALALGAAPAPPPLKVRADGSARAPIAIDSDDDIPRPRPAGAAAAPIYLGALRVQVAYTPDPLQVQYPAPVVSVPAAAKLTLIRESRPVAGTDQHALLIRVVLPGPPGKPPSEIGRLDWAQARFLWTLSAKEKILVQCISREQRMLSVPHADALAVVLMLFLDPRASRYQDANAAPDIPTRRRLKAEHERESVAWRDLFEQLFTGTAAPNIRRVRDGNANSIVSFDLGRFCHGDLAGVTLPETNAPATMRLPLYAHQKQALSWMLSRERDPLLVPNPLFSEYRVLDESGRGFWFNPITAQLTFTPPSPLMMPRGGILADEMGLGKTITTIAIACANPAVAEKVEKVDKSESVFLPPASSGPQSANALVKSRATLVICPLSVLTTWRDEINRAVVDEIRKVRIFYGPCRISDPVDLANSDFVITTYSVIVSEAKTHMAAQQAAEEAKKQEGTTSNTPAAAVKRLKGESALYAINWHRVVLDEAHTVRCKKTLSANAVYKLVAQSRWCLTGTPIHNTLDDLFSLLHFLGTPVYGNEMLWQQLVSRPFQRKDKESLVRLNAVLQALMLRRMKADNRGSGPLVQLPSKTVEIVNLDFSPCEAAAYKALSDASKERFKRLEQQGQVLQNYANVLEMLLRLRQLCDHPSLLPNGYLSGGADVAPMSPETTLKLRELEVKYKNPQLSATIASVLQGTLQECVRCQDMADRPHMLPCGHVSCAECLTIGNGSAWDAGLAACSSCKAEFPTAQAFALPFMTAAALQSELCGIDSSSTKLMALVKDLRTLPSDCKAVVFSQWTSMMDIIGCALEKEQLPYARLDGSMPLQKRQRALDDFSRLPNVRVMLLSLKAGGLGLTLTSANRVYVFDPWWCPASEQQAVDRVHRLGQFKPVTVRRLLINGTIEQRILQLQERKLLLARGAMATRDEMRAFRLEELRLLFDM